MHDERAAHMGGSGRRRIMLFLALLGIVSSYFLGLSATPLLDDDEPRFAEATRVMLETGDYITPTFNGQLRFAKPILIYWLMAGSYRLFGVGELGARFPSAAASALTAIVIVWLVSRMATGRAAWLAAIIWGSFLQTAVWARLATTDATLTLLLTTSYLALYLAFHSHAPHKRPWYLLAGAAMGLGFITKGPIAAGLPLAVAVFYLLSVGRLKAELSQARPWEPLLIFLVIATPWYYLEYCAHGSEFLRIFFLGENIERYAVRGRWEYWQLLYFLPLVLFMTFPFSALLPALVKTGWKRPEPEAKAGDGLPRYLLCWASFIVAFFSLSAVQNPQYVMSAYPALAIFAGVYLDRLRRGDARLEPYEKAAVVLTLVLGAILTTTAAMLPRLLPIQAARRWATPSDDVPLIAGSLAVLAGVGTLAVACSWLLRRRRLAMGAMVATPWLLGLATVFLLAPEIASYREAPLRQLCREARAQLPEDATIVLYGFRSSAAVFYSQRRVLPTPMAPVHTENAVRHALWSDQAVVIIAPRQEMDKQHARALRQLSEWGSQRQYVLLGRPRQQ